MEVGCGCLAVLYREKSYYGRASKEFEIIAATWHLITSVIFDEDSYYIYDL